MAMDPTKNYPCSFTATIHKQPDRTVYVELTGFDPTNLLGVAPDETWSKIKTWSDMVDYWSVDFDCDLSRFRQCWCDYRTRKDRSLRLVSCKHKYDKPGRYLVGIKVVDIFGNDTTNAYLVEV